MDTLVVDDTKIIAFGDIEGMTLQPEWLVYENYNKLWPKGIDGKKLPKALCKFSRIKIEVEAKTQEDLDAEQAEKDKQYEYDKILQKLPELLQDAKTNSLTWEQFLDTI